MEINESDLSKDNLEKLYKKSKSFEDVNTQIEILNDFKDLTDSSSLPIDIKDRFNAVADKDILSLLNK